MNRVRLKREELILDLYMLEPETPELKTWDLELKINSETAHVSMVLECCSATCSYN